MICRITNIIRFFIIVITSGCTIIQISAMDRPLVKSTKKYGRENKDHGLYFPPVSNNPFVVKNISTMSTHQKERTKKTTSIKRDMEIKKREKIVAAKLAEINENIERASDTPLEEEIVGKHYHNYLNYEHDPLDNIDCDDSHGEYAEIAPTSVIPHLSKKKICNSNNLVVQRAKRHNGVGTGYRLHCPATVKRSDDSLTIKQFDSRNTRKRARSITNDNPETPMITRKRKDVPVRNVISLLEAIKINDCQRVKNLLCIYKEELEKHPVGNLLLVAEDSIEGSPFASQAAWSEYIVHNAVRHDGVLFTKEELRKSAINYVSNPENKKRLEALTD